MKVELLSYTPESEILCAVAANTCYSDEFASDRIKDMTKEDAGKMLKRVLASHHESVIEHAYFTFSIEGVSRALTHQLVRSRLCSYSQQSQRYVKMDTPTYVVPPSMDETIAIDSVKLTRKELFEEAMSKAWEYYNDLIKSGVPAEDARFVLPNACTTNIVMSCNARELKHILELRCCRRSQWEIRSVAMEMLRQVKEVSPVIFEDAGPACLRGPCPEGSRSCGHPWNKTL